MYQFLEKFLIDAVRSNRTAGGPNKRPSSGRVGKTIRMSPMSNALSTAEKVPCITHALAASTARARRGQYGQGLSIALQCSP